MQTRARGKFSPRIRVHVGSSIRSKLRIAIDGPYKIQPVGSTRLLQKGARLGPVTVTVTPIGFRIANVHYRVSRLELVALTSPSIWVNDHQYRGTLRLYRLPEGDALAVNIIALEDYLASVVDSEMPATFPICARRAQAIVARTFALYHMEHRKTHPYFDVYSTTRSQRYLGYQYRNAAGNRLAGESASARQASRFTAGIVCTYRGQLFCTYYSAVCGGRTTTGKQVFADASDSLQSVSCRWCEPARFYRWTTRLSLEKARKHLAPLIRANEQSFGKLVSLSAAPREPTAHPKLFKMSDGKNDIYVTAIQLQRQLPLETLYSPRFTVAVDGDDLVLHGHGHGHGVGMCQWGARGMALAGRSALEIVRYYYPGVQLVVVSPEEG
jgi:stage II sporulation protein D